MNSIALLIYDLLLFCFLPEAVTGIVGRADVGSCLFFIASFLAYIKSHKTPTNISLDKQSHTRWPWLLLCFVMCFASMLSKEQGITVLGTCAVYEIMILFSHNKKQTIFVTLTKVSGCLENKMTSCKLFMLVDKIIPSLLYNLLHVHLLCLRKYSSSQLI